MRYWLIKNKYSGCVLIFKNIKLKLKGIKKKNLNVLKLILGDKSTFHIFCL